MYQSTPFNKNDIFENPAYLEAATYLNDALKYGIKPGTERIRALLKELKNPHLKYETILVTGTNGKTSTARMISALLSSHKYQTGLYTSPHLHNYCERIECNGQKISEVDFLAVLDKIKPAINKVNKALGDPLSNFEILTAMAFEHFAMKSVDCAVLEVGMGARFDATCLTKAKVSVITNIEFDHTDYLGNSIEKIATEKSFVIKEGSKIVIGELGMQAQKIIEQKAKDEAADIYTFEKEFRLRSVEKGLDHKQKIDVDGIFCDYRNIKIPAVGKHQARNACLAIAAAELFNGRLLMVRKFKPVLSELCFDGRAEIMQMHPMVIIDGAHNPAGARNLANVLKKEFDYGKLILILAIYKDKDYKGIVSELAPLAKEIIFSENSSQRCLKAEKFATISKNHFQIITSLAEAIETAKKMATANDLICITGSLATVADARTILRR